MFNVPPVADHEYSRFADTPDVGAAIVPPKSQLNTLVHNGAEIAGWSDKDPSALPIITIVKNVPMSLRNFSPDDAPVLPIFMQYSLKVLEGVIITSRTGEAVKLEIELIDIFSAEMLAASPAVTSYR